MVLLLDVVAQDGDRGAADGSGELGPGPQPVRPPVVPGKVRNSCRSLREDTPLRLFTSLDSATLGGKFTSRCTWFGSPLNSASSVWKSAHTARMISSTRVRCAAVNTGCRYLVTKTK